MSREVGLHDVVRCADLIDQTVTLLKVFGQGTDPEREILTGLASRLRVDAETVANVQAERILQVVKSHTVWPGIMASPNHWAYGDPKDGDRPRWFVYCGQSCQDSSRPGCGWDCEPKVFHTKAEATEVGFAHIADEIRKALVEP
jgi:hypothetical protein